MTGFLVLKDKIVNFYNEHGIFVRPVIKFVLTFTALMLLRNNIGYMELLCQPLILLLISVAMAFLPWGMIVVAFVGIVVAQLYALTLELAAIVLLLMLIMFLLFFRFVPTEGMFLLLIPIAFYANVPYMIPLVAGLVCTPVSVVSVTFGTVIYYILDVVKKNEETIGNISTEETSAAGIGSIITMILNNKEMMLTIITFAIVLVLVYVIKRMSIDNAWTKAIISGGAIEFAIFIVGNLLLDTKTSILWLIIGTVISIVIAMVLQFFVFSVDYTRIEHTQFEDDEYYYYVKAVPKINVAGSEMNVKRINAQRQHKSENVKYKKSRQ